ncbi:CHAT domain-containing protein [Marivirga atlantica]|uniref:CHAT domain-containing protein n=1 Tax=Marivirga atlantica TaxID=1548457 RepID=A0A937AIZ0_9BACT|nr:CHAT domain-containing protein [Marivirga atlantica]MBL0764458.1 CHAT domain-containing protein [Marivirga atlantica]
MKGFYYILTIYLVSLSPSIAVGQSSELPSAIETLFNAQQFEEIINSATEIKTYSEKNQDSTSAELLYFLGDAYLAMDQIEAGLTIMEEELELRKDLPNSDPLIMADLSYNLSYYLSLLGEANKAIEKINFAISLYEKNLEPEDEIITSSKIELSKILSNAGKEKQAIATLNSLNSPNQNVSFEINKELGNAYLQLGNYSKADLYFNKAYSIGKNLGITSIQYLQASIYLGDLYFLKSKYGQAEESYISATALAKKIGGLESQIDIMKNNLAMLYWRMGIYDEALALISEINFEASSAINEANRLQNKALILFNIGEIDSAKTYSNKALALLEEIPIKKAEFLKNRASTIYAATGDFKQAISDLTEAKKIFQLEKSKSSPEYSKYEFNLGKIYFKTNDAKLARKYLNEAYKIRKKYLVNTHPLYAEATKELAELNWFENNTKEAQAFYEETFDNYFAQIEAYFPALSEQEKANFYTNTLRPTFEEYNSFVINNYKDKPELLSDMYNYQLATKGLIMYATEKARDQIFNSGDSTLIGVYESWIGTKEQIARLYSLTAEEIETDPLNLDSLQQKANTLEKQLSRESAEFSEAYNNKKLVWQDIQKELKEGEAAIEMIRFRKFIPDSSGQFVDKVFYAALLIDKEVKNPKLVLFENGVDLENKYIKNYKNAIKYKVQDKYSYSQYWKPIAAKTSKYNLIYLSPDGIYNQISINSLYNNETQKYVLEEQNIQLLTNTKDLIALRNPDNSKYADAGKSALFGFPNYNKGLDNKDETQQVDASEIANNVSLDRGLRGSLSRYIRGNSLVTALPGTKEEVEKINILYQELTNDAPKVNLANEADELAVKRVNNPKVLHIATHGFFLEDAESEVESADDKYAQNPLLKSGMILAGANSFITSGVDEETGQDGILTAYEAMNLNLNATELVILSACETGLGDLKNGEGVYGLRRAFFVAGADAIIMSLWSVDDAATQELMTEFYKHWLGGKTKQEAFLMAQNFTKDKYKDPFYWGAFVMVGE